MDSFTGKERTKPGWFIWKVCSSSFFKKHFHENTHIFFGFKKVDIVVEEIIIAVP
ncbi:hypothetical protein SEETMRM9437_9305 [Salmonella enterica subsp. enterica serovar Typhimurium]|nr:hypothetical protein FORC20_2624 [Salmonella enterica subsp. enterica serovar Typhimurium]ARE52006.1 Phage outer membrane lytic protein Rz [Salmonella enterica]EYR76952.1 hypothetical protein I654_02225 [Salmonella enterica subsp. enterica serovar Aqua str. NVSL2001]OLW43513.1 hypothetical protein P285_08055 [Salmonella enterica subsp. arizonae serovar 18:z4,z23:- str. CVM N27]OLY41753.1 hypothetical protein P282_08800 [Salmonella enterica subsp. arizonae serovar 18:z4,z23:- str. CVM 32457]